MKATVRITADDAGALPAIDTAILELLELGVLTRAAVFCNGPGFARFVALAAPFSIVPHLTLTYGCPLSDPRRLAPLLNADGNFLQPLNYFDGDIDAAVASWIENAFSRCDSKFATKEILRQLEHFVAVTGRRVESLTFHHDIDKHIDSIREARTPVCLANGRAGLIQSGLSSGARYTFLAPDTSPAAATSGVLEVLEGAIASSRASGGLPAEAVFHPSRDTTNLNGFTAYASGRVLEYGALKDPAVQRLLRKATREGDRLVFY